MAMVLKQTLSASPPLISTRNAAEQCEGEPGAVAQPVPGVRNRDGAQRNILVAPRTLSCSAKGGQH
jgi:hypothetical protein